MPGDLGCLTRLERRDHFRDVFLGVGAALLLATAVGVAVYATVRQYDGSRGQTIFETVTYLLAAAVLTYMFFGYSDSPTPLQLLVYVAYLAIVIVAYLGLRDGLRARRKTTRTAS